MYNTNFNNLDNRIINNHQIKSPVVYSEFTPSNFPRYQDLTLYSELLQQFENFKFQLKGEKLRDKMVYQSLKNQLSTSTYS